MSYHLIVSPDFLRKSSPKWNDFFCNPVVAESADFGWQGVQVNLAFLANSKGKTNTNPDGAPAAVID
ncbi:hypothetical protein [Kamptonema sp. UHCC 0994]|uniref:hypothetical protein n=1 Tax=Kamptonema sp. UHCC 0994 TaxID=3031329 RepID=UPI0023BA641B|nr:hypothetical protein [Kamptonema sp. UHCC 0994]MDF0556713.1 hypothetical protein [Kamptonema sp. UHCC 0994]